MAIFLHEVVMRVQETTLLTTEMQRLPRVEEEEVHPKRLMHSMLVQGPGGTVTLRARVEGKTRMET
jgi:hypothetical protein